MTHRAWTVVFCAALACSASETAPADPGQPAPDTGPAPTPDAGFAVDAGPVVPTPDAGIARTPDDISDSMATILDAEGLIALGGAVVDRDGLLAVGAAGLRSRIDTVRVTPEDRWHLGSDTKSMTAMLAAVLVEQGRLSWTTTLEQAFPAFAAEIQPAYRSMTLVELLAHRSGLPGEIHPDLWSRLWQNIGPRVDQRRQFARDILARDPEAAPGTRYIYSNAGFMIAGTMMEVATGQSWEDLMRTELFAPLGMTDCGFGPSATVGTLDAPLGHRPTDPPEPVPAGPQADNPPALGPAGTVHCSLASWANYIAEHLRRGSGENPLLSAESFDRLQADPGFAAGPNDGYGYGWFITQRPWAGGLTLTHSGSNTMNYAVAWVAPLRNRAYLAVANQGGVAASVDRAIGAMLSAYPPR